MHKPGQATPMQMLQALFALRCPRPERFRVGASLLRPAWQAPPRDPRIPLDASKRPAAFT